MTAKLFCRSGALDGESFTIESEASIGRGSDNQIQLETTLVSTHHARLFRDPESGAWVLEDLNSLNGTELDGVPIRGTSERLRHLHVLSFGGSADFIFLVVGEEHAAPTVPDPEPAPIPSTESPSPPTAAASGGTMAEQLAPALPSALANASASGRGPTPDGRDRTQIEQAAAPMPSFLAGERAPAAETGGPPRYSIEITDASSGDSRTVELQQGETTIGRAADAAIRIATDYLSRRHAVLTVSGAEITVRDLGSTNGTFVGERRLEQGEEAPLAPGDELCLGEYVLRVHTDERGE